MRVLGLTVRDFRAYGATAATLGPTLTVVSGPNGAGKTNLLEAIYFGCTARSCRTVNDRELVRFGAESTRVVVNTEAEDGEHELAVGFRPGEPKQAHVDGASVERLLDAPARPLLSVFMPDRLELIKGAPSLRRAHLDQVVAALWPARVATRRAYAQALAQRNALIGRIRSGSAPRSSLSTWDAQMAGYGIALMGDRKTAVDGLSDAFQRLAGELGLGDDVSIEYRPRSRATKAEELAMELADRAGADIERGYTMHGPHRDELVTAREGRELRPYGSQGQQRLALLTLLLAEREAISSTRTSPPVMLLDDVMSELDGQRRELLVELLRRGAGQSVITTTDLDHVPGAMDGDVARLFVSENQVHETVVMS